MSDAGPAAGEAAPGVRARLAAVAGTVRGDRAWSVVAGAALGGLVLRLAWVVVAAREPKPLFDPWRYHGYALGLADGRGLVDPLTGEPTAYFPPGYPAFLGAVQVVLQRTPLPGELPLVAGLLQAVMGAAAVVLVGLLARRLHSPAAGGVAAVAMAAYPNLVLHAGVLLSETLAVLLLLGVLVALVPPPSGAGPWPAGVGPRRRVAAGLLLGGLLLVRPVSAGLLLAVAVAWLVAGRGWWRTAREVGAVALIALLCLAPWTVRNAVRLDAFVLLSTNTGDNLCIGHGPGATGGFRLGSEDCATGTGVQDGTEGELRNDRQKTELALRHIREGWRDEPRLTWKRFVATVERDDDAVRATQSYDLATEVGDPWLGRAWTDRLSTLSNAAWFLVAAVGLVGCARLLGREGDRLLVPLAALGLLLAPLATFGDPRFKVPMVPLLIVAAAVAVTRRAPGAAVASAAPSAEEG